MKMIPISSATVEVETKENGIWFWTSPVQIREQIPIHKLCDYIEEWVKERYPESSTWTISEMREDWIEKYSRFELSMLSASDS